jgi:small-conductance mechanosensitive channel
MNWNFSLPVMFLVLTVLLYYLTRKNPHLKKLKSVIPFLFVLIFLSLIYSVLTLEMVSNMFRSEGLETVLQLLILFFILIFSVKFSSFFLFDFLFSQKMAIKYPRLIKDIIVIILYSIGILLIANQVLNIRVTEVLASAAVLTVVAGFALQDILGDLFSGIALNLEESLKIGDWIKLGEYEGRIEQFRWRSIKIRTIDNVLVVVPNQTASRQAVSAFAHSGEYFALRLEIGVSYKNSPDLVIRTIREAMASVDLILGKPAPQVFVNRFDDFSIVYELRYFFKDYSKKNIIHSEINRKTWYAFKRKGIEIPFPIRDVYIKKAVEEKMTDEELIAVLKSNDLLGSIDESELKNLLEGIEVKVYGAGEVLITRGEAGRCFFLILEGEVEVMKNHRVINQLGPNDYFGEFSLFTGEKTTADVRASMECKVLVISSEKFRETVKLNKDMARKLSEAIALRKAKLKEFDEKETDAAQLTIKKDTENIFLRIKKYFSF